MLQSLFRQLAGDRRCSKAGDEVSLEVLFSAIVWRGQPTNSLVNVRIDRGIPY